MEPNNIHCSPLIKVGQACRQISDHYCLLFDITELMLVTGLSKMGHAFKVSECTHYQPVLLIYCNNANCIEKEKKMIIL